jgi:uncharacterized membrane protein YdbT with pleckstrin-like domain
MEKSDFYYKRKQAFISFLSVYLLCIAISFLLIENSPAISREVIKRIMKLGILHSNTFQNLPYGIISSLPFVIYGIRTLLWNMMTSYEITSSEIRLLAGSLTRKERYVLISNFYEISFKQSLIEAPFRVGTLILKKEGAELVIKGVYDVKYVVESLRGKMGTSYR